MNFNLQNFVYPSFVDNIYVSTNDSIVYKQIVRFNHIL